MPIAVLLGATSGIGEALARELALSGYDLILAGRDEATLACQARDLEIRYGVRAWPDRFEALDFASHPGRMAHWTGLAGGDIDGVALCYGAMANESEAASDPEAAQHMINVNYASPVSILDRVADAMEANGRGWICAITSVAGDRGRATNFHYGSTKSALSAYLSGLRVRLARSGIAVTDVRPGMVDTKLTYGLPDLVLLAQPTSVARDIAKAIRSGSPVVYTPGFWALIMLVIRLIPTTIFKRLPL